MTRRALTHSPVLISWLVVCAVAVVAYVIVELSA